MKSCTNVRLSSGSKLSIFNEVKLKAVQQNWIPSALLRRRLKQDLKRWEKGRQGPYPHLLKQRVVLKYAALSGARVFIETGTFYGFMLQACLGHFDRLISMEVEPHFFRRAQEVFRPQPQVTLLNGDSAKLLPEVLAAIASPCLFWLDAHYSGGVTGRANLETPIRQELAAILKHPNRHTILIDDAECFDGTHDYPEIDSIQAAAQKSGYTLSLADNIIRIVP